MTCWRRLFAHNPPTTELQSHSPILTDRSVRFKSWTATDRTALSRETSCRNSRELSWKWRLVHCHRPQAQGTRLELWGNRALLFEAGFPPRDVAHVGLGSSEACRSEYGQRDAQYGQHCAK